MIVKLDKISSAFYNDKLKTPMTKKDRQYLYNSIATKGFIGNIIVCPDWNNEGNFICLDGHTRLEILRELEYTEIDCIVNEKVGTEKEVSEFIIAYDYVSKKYNEKEIYNLANMSGIDLNEIINFNSEKFNIDVPEVVVEQEQFEIKSFYLRLRADTVDYVRRRFKDTTKNSIILTEFMEKIDDEEMFTYIMEMYKDRKGK